MLEENIKFINSKKFIMKKEPKNIFMFLVFLILIEILSKPKKKLK